ncbi:hypothetical protein STEG23_015058, partial [Scotinomys teguina]
SHETPGMIVWVVNLCLILVGNIRKTVKERSSKSSLPEVFPVFTYIKVWQAVVDPGVCLFTAYGYQGSEESLYPVVYKYRIIIYYLLKDIEVVTTS